MNPPAPGVAALLLGLLLAQSAAADSQNTLLNMPGVLPTKADAYLCTSVKLDPEQAHYLVGFKPHASMMTAHHMLLFACSEPGTDEDVWECGEMAASQGKELTSAPPCSEGSQIIYAWAKDAPELKLPKDVGFKVGGNSGVRHLVLQVHYMHPMESEDFSGLELVSTVQRMPKRAGTLLMVTGGEIQKKSKEHFETACVIDEAVQMHPFAFRTHTHKLGKVVSGWKVQRKDGQDVWTLIGKRDPQLPQMFYPVADPGLVVNEGDVVAARCSMENDQDNDVAVGPTGSDEMCNFYMMYYVEGDDILSDNTCYSPGPPTYHWAREGGLNNVPDKDADTL